MMTTKDSNDNRTEVKDPLDVEALAKMLSFLDYLDTIARYRPSPNEVENIVNYFLNLPKVELRSNMKVISQSNVNQARGSVPRNHRFHQIEDILYIRPIYLEDEVLVSSILTSIQNVPGIVNVNLNEKKIHNLTRNIFESGEYGGFIAFIEDTPVGLGVISTIIGALGRIELYIQETFGQEEVAHGLVGELVRLAMLLEYKSLFCKLAEPNDDYEAVLRKKGFFAATDEQIRPLFEKINETPDRLLFIMPKVPKIPRFKPRRLDEE